MYFLGLAAQASPKLQTFWKYAKVELAPPTLADIPEIRAGISRLLAELEQLVGRRFQ